MINEQRRGRPTRKRLNNEPTHTVWAESDNQGGFLIFAGIQGTDVKTYAGSARSRDSLDYNIRKAKMRFGLPIS